MGRFIYQSYLLICLLALRVLISFAVALVVIIDIKQLLLRTSFADSKYCLLVFVCLCVCVRVGGCVLVGPVFVLTFEPPVFVF